MKAISAFVIAGAFVLVASVIGSFASNDGGNSIGVGLFVGMFGLLPACFFLLIGLLSLTSTGAKAAPKDARTYLKKDDREATCPNCDAIISASSQSCPHCSAVFTDDSAWRPRLK